MTTLRPEYADRCDRAGSKVNIYTVDKYDYNRVYIEALAEEGLEIVSLPSYIYEIRRCQEFGIHPICAPMPYLAGPDRFMWKHPYSLIVEEGQTAEGWLF